MAHIVVNCDYCFEHKIYQIKQQNKKTWEKPYVPCLSGLAKRTW